MKKYEILVILKPNLEKTILEENVLNIEKKFGGEIVQKTELGIKKFAYPIKKYNEGFYILYYIKTNPENILNLRKFLTISKDVLRNLILVHEDKFPFEMTKTSKDLQLPERKPREEFNKFKKPYDPSFKKEGFVKRDKGTTNVK